MTQIAAWTPTKPLPRTPARQGPSPEPTDRAVPSSFLDREHQLELLRRYQEHGDTEALHVLYRYLRDMALPGPMRPRIHRDDVDDLVQATLLDFYRQVQRGSFSWRGPAGGGHAISPSSRCLNILRNKAARAYRRRRKAASFVDPEAVPERLSGAARDGVDRCIAEEERALLHAAFAALEGTPDRPLRTALGWSYGMELRDGRVVHVESLSLRKIAARLGIPGRWRWVWRKRKQAMARIERLMKRSGVGVAQTRF